MRIFTQTNTLLRGALSLLVLLLTPLAVLAQTETTLTGDGTSDDPYLIGSVEDWNAFAEKVNSGETTACAKLIKDVATATTMVGTSENRYGGTFDGDGHSLTINYLSDEENTAPFRFVNGATIKNLRITGTITTSNRSASGFIADAIGYTLTITNCESNVGIKSSYDGRGSGGFGGFVGYSEAPTIINSCLFSGFVEGSSVHDIAGFVSQSSFSSTLSNCLLIAIFSIKSEDSFSQTFVRDNGIGTTITNCYYKNALGQVQGNPVTDSQLASGELTWMLQDGSDKQVWGQKLTGDDADPSPVFTTDEFKKVFKVTYQYAGYVVATQYANSTGVSEIPEIVKGRTLTFDGKEFSTSTPITEDITVTVTGEKLSLNLTVADIFLTPYYTRPLDISGKPDNYDGYISCAVDSGYVLISKVNSFLGLQGPEAQVHASFTGSKVYKDTTLHFRIYQASGIKVNNQYFEYYRDRGCSYDWWNNVFTVSGEGSFTFSGSYSDGSIKIVIANSCDITFDNFSFKHNGFEINSGCNVNLHLKGSSILQGNSNNAGIHVPEGASLTIVDGNTLKVTGGGESAAIGGNSGESGGNITIKGGNVEANVLGDGEGITEHKASIVITGGSVKTSTINGTVTDGENNVYKVTIPNLRSSEAVTFKGLPQSYGTKGISADNDGKVYIWLPSSSTEYRFFANGKPYTVTVNDAETEAVEKQKEPMTLSVENITLNIGDSVKPVISGLPEDYDGKITYTLNRDDYVNFVDGVFTAKHSGDVYVNVKFEDSFTYEDANVAFYVLVNTGIKIDGEDINNGKGDNWLFFSDSKELVLYDEEHVMTGGNTTDNIYASIYRDCGIVLDDLTLKGKGVRLDADLDNLENGLAVNLLLKGDNFLISSDDNSGIGLKGKSKLTIDLAEGETNAALTVTGGEHAAGIGIMYGEDKGAVIIKGGKITANGGIGAAAIGGCRGSSGGTIIIEGGNVVANANPDGGYSIGDGEDYNGEKARVVITGGSVKAESINGIVTNSLADDGSAVYKVTVPGLTANGKVALSGLPEYYNVKDIEADEDGSIYLWLPDGKYTFVANDVKYEAVVDGNFVTAEIYKEVIDEPTEPGDNPSTDIQGVSTSGNAPVVIYNLRGQRVGDSLKSLPKGIYIVNGKKVLKR